MKVKKILIIFTVLLMIMGLSVTAFALEAEETNLDSKIAQWKVAKLERMQERLDSLVSAGKLTMEQANTMLEAMKQRQADCDGTGCANQGECDGTGAGFGGFGRGNKGKGNGVGAGGFGNRNGNCPFLTGGNG